MIISMTKPHFKVLLVALFLAAFGSVLSAGETADGHDLAAQVGKIFAAFREQGDEGKEKALKDLTALGKGGAYELEKYYLDENDSVSVLAAEAMSALAGEGGKANCGLSLSVVQTGHIPAKEELASFWVVITNVSQSGIYFLQKEWRPTVLPVGTALPKDDEPLSLGESQRRNFISLRPGDSFSCLIFSNVLDAAREADKTKLHLLIPKPVDLWYPGVDERMTSRILLESQPFILKTNADDTALKSAKAEFEETDAKVYIEKDWPVLNSMLNSIDEEIMDHGLDCARMTIASGKQEMIPTMMATIIKALTSGLDNFGDAYIDLSMFPDTVDDAELAHKMALIAARSIYTSNDSLIDEAQRFSSNERQQSQKFAADFMAILYNRQSLPEDLKLNYAWLLYTHFSDSIYNPRLAVRIAEDIDMNDYLSTVDRFTVALIKNDRNEINRQLDDISDDEANNVAWKIAISGRPSLDNLLVALKLSKRSVKATRMVGVAATYRIDTLAAVYAAIHDFKKAVELQTEACSRAHWSKDYTLRLVKYFGLMHEEKENLPASVFEKVTFKSDMVRAAMLKELKKPGINDTYAALLIASLRANFPDHETVKALDAEPEIILDDEIEEEDVSAW
ncbi:MAG: hypothetical protein JXQ25_07170 [Deltaproteobacteria bacterium]|nr:hypothetical protein [Deltaproteobacteria bacterium]